jgi:hypothetical protein
VSLEASDKALCKRKLGSHFFQKFLLFFFSSTSFDSASVELLDDKVLRFRLASALVFILASVVFFFREILVSVETEELLDDEVLRFRLASALVFILASVVFFFREILVLVTVKRSISES